MAKNVFSPVETSRLRPPGIGQFVLPPSIEIAGTTGTILQADCGWHAANDTFVFPLTPAKYFNVHIPLPKFWLRGTDGGELKLSSIFTELWIDRPHPELIGTATLHSAGLPGGGTQETSWVGGEDGPKKYKQTGYRWATAQPFAGGGFMEVGFLQAVYGEELSVSSAGFEPVTIHLMKTTLIFAKPPA